MTELTTTPPVQQNEQVMSVGKWVLTLFLLMIPIVNIILLFVWGFGSETNPNKKNYARASLILMLIGIGFYAVIFILLLVSGLQ